MTSLSPIERMRLLRESVGLVSKETLQNYANRILSEEFPDAKRDDCGAGADGEQLTLMDFLRSKGVEPLRKKVLKFGRAVKSAYMEEHGREPDLNNNQCVYTQADRSLMERVWVGFSMKEEDK